MKVGLKLTIIEN